jgi:transposase
VDNDYLYYNFRVLSKKKIFEKYYRYMINLFYTSSIYDRLKHTLTDTTFILNCYGVESTGKCKQYKYKKGNKISFIADSKGIPISINIGSGNEHDAKLLIKNLNNLYIDKKSYLLKDNNRYYQFLLLDAIYDTEAIKNKLKN